MTEKFRVVVFPATSLTVTVSLVVPCGNVDPLVMGVTLTVAMPLMASAGEGLNATTAPRLDVAWTVRFGRFATDGAILSILIVSV